STAGVVRAKRKEKGSRVQKFKVKAVKDDRCQNPNQKKESLMVRYFLGFLRNSTINSRMSLESAARLSYSCGSEKSLPAVLSFLLSLPVASERLLLVSRSLL